MTTLPPTPDPATPASSPTTPGLLDPLAPLPTIGRIVTYRARTRGYALPAIVIATEATLDPEGVRRGDVPALSGPGHVHLHVFTPGAQVGYQEFDVEQGDGPGRWSWPARS